LQLTSRTGEQASPFTWTYLIYDSHGEGWKKIQMKILTTGWSIEAGDVSEHNGVRTHGYGLRPLHLHRLQLWDVPIGVSCQNIAIQQHLLALQIPALGSEMVLLSRELGRFAKPRNLIRHSALLPCTLGLCALACNADVVCVVAIKVDQE
jgi:hypothetical protein